MSVTCEQEYVFSTEQASSVQFMVRGPEDIKRCLQNFKNQKEGRLKSSPYAHISCSLCVYLFLLAPYCSYYPVKILLILKLFYYMALLSVILAPTCQTVVGFEIICEFLFEKDFWFKMREMLDEYILTEWGSFNIMTSSWISVECCNTFAC